jgi:hypothetical protein
MSSSPQPKRTSMDLEHVLAELREERDGIEAAIFITCQVPGPPRLPLDIAVLSSV